MRREQGRAGRWTRADPRLASLLVVALAMGGIAVAAYLTDSLEPLELGSVDARFDLRPESRPRDVAVVAIDDVTFEELGMQWPFPRSLHARVIDRLRKAGAKVIAYDVQFTEPTEAREDEALIRASARAGNVVFATTEANERGRTLILGGGRDLRESRAKVAGAALGTDRGAVVRRIKRSVERLPTLPTVAAQEFLGWHVGSFPGGRAGAWIDYPGPPGTIPTHSFSQVFKGKVPGRAFRNRLVVVGASAPSLQDLHPTSTSGSRLMSGAEIQAAAARTALHGFPLQEPGAAVDLPLIALLALAGALLAYRLGPLRSALASLAIGLLYALVAYLLFEWGVIVSLVYPLVALGLTVAGSVGVQYAVASFERERSLAAFSRFVGPAVVDKVMEMADGLRLGGTLTEATVLFNDMRGFTTYSESRPASETIEVLNRYLTLMADVVLDHDGTLIGYRGDGFLATFGAPVPVPDHADRALSAARAMMPSLDEFNEWFVRETGLEPFRIGIGINTGEVVSGNVGTERRIEYATIGDVVNTAARIETLSKAHPHTILLSDATRRALSGDHQDLVDLGDQEIRGRIAAVRVWAVDDGR